MINKCRAFIISENTEVLKNNCLRLLNFKFITKKNKNIFQKR